MTEFEEERFRELAGRVMAGTCSEEERGEVEAGLLGGGRAAEVFAEEARASVVTETFFVGERKRLELVARFGEPRRHGGGWRWAAAAVLVGLLGIVGLMWERENGRGGADARVAEGRPPVIASEERTAEGGVTGVEELEDGPVENPVEEEPEDVDAVLARFFLPEVEIDDVPLGEALALLGESLRTYNINGRESLETLVLGAGRGIEENRVTLKTRGVPFMTVLKSLAAQVGGEVVVDPPVVALVAGEHPQGEALVTRTFAGAGELVGADKDKVAELLAAWGVRDVDGSTAVPVNGSFVVRTTAAGLASTEVMLGEMQRRKEEPLTLEIIKVVVEDPVVAGDGGRRVETREAVERFAGEHGLEVSSEVVSWPDQEPVITGGSEGSDPDVEETADPDGGAEDEGTPLSLFAGLGDDLTLIPVRMGESIAVLSESSGFAVGDSSVFLDANSLMSLGALGGLSAGDVPAVFFVGAAEVDRGSVTSSEGEGP